MSESAIYFVIVFTTLLLVGGLGYTLFEFKRAEAKQEGARVEAESSEGARRRARR